MAFRVDFGIWGSIFPVPTAIADRHIKFCSEAQLKVLLLALRDGSDLVDSTAIGHRLGLPAEEVEDCLDYWRQAGLFSLCNPPEAPVPAKAAAAPVSAAPAHTVTETTVTPEGQRITAIRSRSHLTVGEINDLMAQDQRFPDLIAELEQRFGKVLSPTEREAVAYLYRYLELSADYILMAAAYCRGQGKTSLRYLEKVVSGWVDDGIDTFEKAELHLKKLTERQSFEARIRRMFGLPDRALTSRERECMTRWDEAYHSPDELIQLAYDRTVEATGKVSFAYLDKILGDWYRKGIVTPAAAMQERAPAKSEQGEHSYDINEAFRIMDMNSNH